jgi:nucleoid-associated protein YgaU
MADRPTKLVVDCATGITTEVPLTDAEIAQRETDVLAVNEAEAARKAEEDAKAAAKASAQEKLAALGLSSEEVAALLK